MVVAALQGGTTRQVSAWRASGRTTACGGALTGIDSANANAERSRREAITSYLKTMKVPRDLLQRIHQYYDFVGGVSVREELLMPALPATARW